MILFRDRVHAGQLLAEKLLKYKNNEKVVVLGIPRGGVLVAAEIAKVLRAPLDVVIIKKIGVPHNEELALGAAGVEEYEIDENIKRLYAVPSDYIKKMIAEKQREAKERYMSLQYREIPLSLKNKIVIIVDDGLATGATMKLAVKIVDKEEPKELVVAVPVAPPDTVTELEHLCDRVVCLKTPHDFAAISQFYEQFPQVEDEAVKEVLWRHKIYSKN